MDTMMKHTLKWLIVLAAWLPMPSAFAALNIFACTPEWGALAKELAGDKANIYNATNALQDPHHVEARPSLIADRKSTRLNSSHSQQSRMPSSA